MSTGAAGFRLPRTRDRAILKAAAGTSGLRRGPRRGPRGRRIHEGPGARPSSGRGLFGDRHRQHGAGPGHGRSRASGW
ncbi:MAG: hypothetical protein MZU95_15610 [Desulfomicrobium escambiense]|nr:hypothetical protein [Desulfomicrobium escambiense]